MPKLHAQLHDPKVLQAKVLANVCTILEYVPTICFCITDPHKMGTADQLAICAKA